MQISRYALAIATFAALAGCVSSGTRVTGAQTASFKVGVSTERQVIAALGAPQASATATDGTKTDTYLYTTEHATAATWIPVVGLLAGGAKQATKSVTFNFTATGLLASESTASGVTKVRTGLLNQH